MAEWKTCGDGILSRNYVLEGDGFHVSYNANPGIMGFMSGDREDGETALVKHGDDAQFFILNGDHRKAYEPLVPKGWAACLAYYHAHPKDKSSYSTEWRLPNDSAGAAYRGGRTRL